MKLLIMTALITIRLITSPFLLCILLIAALRQLIISMSLFIMYGGEWMKYERNYNGNTVKKSLEELINNKPK